MTDCSTHKGHRRFVGGLLDGQVDHLVYATPGDFPLMIRFPNGSLYERNLDGGTEAVYKLVADNDQPPDRAQRRQP